MGFRSDREALLARIAALETQLRETHGDRESLARELEQTRAELEAERQRPEPDPVPAADLSADKREQAEEERAQKLGLRIGIGIIIVTAAILAPILIWRTSTSVEGSITVGDRTQAFEECAHVDDPRDPFRAIDLTTADGTRVRLLESALDGEVTTRNPARTYPLRDGPDCQADTDASLEDETTDEWRGTASFDCTVDGTRIRITAEYRHCD